MIMWVFIFVDRIIKIYFITKISEFSMQNDPEWSRKNGESRIKS